MSLLENNFIRVFLGLTIGLGFIVYFNPPRTVCTAQIGVYKDAILSLSKSFGKTLSNCREHPEPGGCVAFFDVLGKMEARFNEVTRQCQPDLASDGVTRDWITTSMELYTRLAWGSKPPPSYLYRNGWLELTQVVEFCRLRHHLEIIYGRDAWAGFVSGILTDLPGESELVGNQNEGQNAGWQRSLLSDPCNYPL